MMRLISAISFGLALAFAPAPLLAQQSKPAAKAPALRAGKDEKVCNYKFPDGEKRSWVCKKAEPCCAWDAIKYVKCGSTITNCL